MKSLLFLIPLLFLLSCSPSNKSIPILNTKIISDYELKVVLDKNGIKGYNEIIDDKQYQVVTKDWINNYFYPKLKKELFDNNLVYNNESWDCDDFAIMGKLIAAKLNNLSNNKGKCGIAAGKLNYVKDISDTNVGFPHGINIFLIEENGIIKLFFLEPQSGMEYKLTEDEILNIQAFEF